MRETTTVADQTLRARLGRHHATYSPFYQGYLSDHGPMATLALLGLGAGATEAADYLDDYSRRLEPLNTAPADYLNLLEQMQRSVTRLGAAGLLDRELPALISGWARDAYHPLIRTAYGYQYGIDEEVAAGLAYLKWCGPDPALAAHAAGNRATATVSESFAAMTGCATSVRADRNFTACIELVVNHSAFSAAANALNPEVEAFGRHALAIFARTHNFFALHLVTGTQAFLTLYPFAGEHRDAILALGLLAGYAAVGAPAYQGPGEALPEGPSAVPDPDWLQLISKDEHDIKLAHSAVCLAVRAARIRPGSGRPYLDVARDYLNRSAA